MSNFYATKQLNFDYTWFCYSKIYWIVILFFQVQIDSGYFFFISLAYSLANFRLVNYLKKSWINMDIRNCKWEYPCHSTDLLIRLNGHLYWYYQQICTLNTFLTVFLITKSSILHDTALISSTIFVNHLALTTPEV